LEQIAIFTLNFKMRPAINRELSCVKFRQNRNGIQFVNRFLVGRVRDSLCKLPRKKAKGAFVSESALHISMAISRILSAQHFASKVLGG